MFYTFDSVTLIIVDGSDFIRKAIVNARSKIAFRLIDSNP
jgi:hypothetical protein